MQNQQQSIALYQKESFAQRKRIEQLEYREYLLMRENKQLREQVQDMRRGYRCPNCAEKNKESVGLHEQITKLKKQIVDLESRLAELSKPLQTIVGTKELEDGLYEGQLQNGVPNGKGTLKLKNGNKYEGQWKDGKWDGKGIYYCANGNRYEGQYKDDKRNGKGIYYYANGDRYEGQFKDDKRNGKGIYYYADGTRYEGQYKDGGRNGKGIYYCADGRKEQLVYDMGKQISSRML